MIQKSNINKNNKKNFKLEIQNKKVQMANNSKWRTQKFSRRPSQLLTTSDFIPIREKSTNLKSMVLITPNQTTSTSQYCEMKKQCVHNDVKIITGTATYSKADPAKSLSYCILHHFCIILHSFFSNYSSRSLVYLFANPTTRIT